MTNYEHINNFSFNELLEFFNGLITSYDNPPWQKWFTENYCDKCEAIKGTFDYGNGVKHEAEFCFCEMEKHCKFFPKDGEKFMDDKWLINKWLLEEIR